MYNLGIKKTKLKLDSGRSSTDSSDIKSYLKRATLSESPREAKKALRIVKEIVTYSLKQLNSSSAEFYFHNTFK